MVGARNARRSAGFAVINKPANSVAPVITGTTTSGSTLTCSTGTWSKSPTLSYQWNRNGVPIAGATASTRLLAAPDVGSTLTCTVKGVVNNVQTVVTTAPTATIT